MDDFYAARSSTKPPLPWTNFPPPFSHKASWPSVAPGVGAFDPARKGPEAACQIHRTAYAGPVALAADSLAGCCPLNTSSPCSATNRLPAPQIGYCDPQPISNDGSSIHFPSISPALSSALLGADANVAGGSILLAHNPPKWVNFARRFTLIAIGAPAILSPLTPKTATEIALACAASDALKSCRCTPSTRHPPKP